MKAAAVLLSSLVTALFVAACGRSRGCSPPPEAQRGWVREANGSTHRTAAFDCAPRHDNPPCAATATEHQCRADTDCATGPHGRCVMAHLFSEPGYGGTCFCSFTCATDTDCGEGRACVCQGGGSGHCAPAGCRTDADCSGGDCALSVVQQAGGNAFALACRGFGDTCSGDGDCHDPLHPRCVYHPREQKWACDSGRDMF